MIKLLKEEVEELKGNKDAIAQLLVRKAILEEISKKKYTEEEKKQIDLMKLNVEIEYYLTSIAKNNITIYDYELLDIYKNNIETFKDKTAAEVSPQLKQVLYNKKLGEEKTKIINEVIEKHKINDILKTYINESKDSKLESKAKEK